jgi:hypothetical protein
LGLRRAWRHTAAAMEVQAIGATDPFANEKKAKRPGGRPTGRKRLPPWAGSGRRAKRQKETRDRLALQRQYLGPGKPPGRGKAQGLEEKEDDDPPGGGGTLQEGEEEAWIRQEEQGPLDTPIAVAGRKRMVRRLKRFEKEKEEGRRATRKTPSVPLGGSSGREEKRGKKGFRKLRNKLTVGEERKWSMNWEEAYADLQRRRKGHSGVTGPVDIFVPKHRRLLLTYLTTKDPVFDWKEVEEKWDIPHPEITLAGLVEKIPGPIRARRAWRRIENRMKEKGIPLRRELIIHVDERVPKAILRRAAAKDIRMRGYDEAMEKWMIQNMEVRHEKGRTFFDLRNGGAVVRGGKLADAERTMAEEADAVVGGAGFRRVPGCAKLPIPLSTRDQVEAINGSVRKLG